MKRFQFTVRRWPRWDVASILEMVTTTACLGLMVAFLADPGIPQRPWDNAPAVTHIARAVRPCVTLPSGS